MTRTADFSTPDDLPLPRRLALSYASRSSRGDIAALWRLDQRLGQVLQAQGEVLIAQIKLAWWRDRLHEDPTAWPAGEPLLRELMASKVPSKAYRPLVDGWERLLDEELTAASVREFAEGHAGAWRTMAVAHGAPESAEVAAQAAREIAYLDLALHLGTEAEARAARQVALACKWHAPRLPRTLRPLAVLHGLSKRALRAGSADLLDGPRAGLLALRIGLFGR